MVHRDIRREMKVENMDNSGDKNTGGLAWWVRETMRGAVLALACAGMLTLSYRTIFGVFNAL